MPPLVGQLPKFEGSWTEEPTDNEMPAVLTWAKKVSKLKRLGLIEVGIVVNWWDSPSRSFEETSASRLYGSKTPLAKSIAIS
jgi:hypothetical protein